MGAARELALLQAEQQLDRLARLLPNALAGGLSLAEISRVTGVSRPTLYELKARYDDSDADLRLAVLQAVARNPGRSTEELQPTSAGGRQNCRGTSLNSRKTGTSSSTTASTPMESTSGTSR